MIDKLELILCIVKTQKFRSTHIPLSPQRDFLMVSIKRILRNFLKDLVSLVTVLY